MENNDFNALLDVLISKNIKFTRKDLCKDFIGILSAVGKLSEDDVNIVEKIDAYLNDMVDKGVLIYDDGKYINSNKKEKMSMVKRNLIDKNIDHIIEDINENIELVNKEKIDNKNMILRLLDIEIRFAKASKDVLDFHKEYFDEDLSDKGFFIWNSDKKLLDLYMKRTGFNNLVHSYSECHEFLSNKDVIKLFIDLYQTISKGTYNISNDRFVEEIKENILKEVIDLYYDFYYDAEFIDLSRVYKLKDNFEYYCLFAGEQENYFDTYNSRIVIGPQFGTSINGLLTYIYSKTECDIEEIRKIR